MDKQKPLVSIILSVYKSDKFLQACLESLSSQTHKNIEIIAVVDYLGDESLKLLRKYKKIDNRLKIYSNVQRYGLATTLNKAMNKARGNYIAFMDSKGIAASSRVSKQVSFLLSNPKVAAVGSQVIAINENNKKLGKVSFPLDHEEISRDLITAEPVKFETFMVDRTRVPKDTLEFKKGREYPFIFIDVFLKIAQYKQIANLDQALVQLRIRKGTNNLELNKRLTHMKVLLDSLFSYDHRPSLKAIFTPLIKQY